jgi:pimeloyl-ACP methyl ester carboxylesterase
MGGNTKPLGEVTLSLWADFVAALVEKTGERVVLVGHSRGGIVISEVAERIPDSIAALVYLTAFLVPSGKTLSDMLSMHEGREVAKGAIVLNPDGISSTIRPEKIAPVFYNTTNAALQARAVSLLSAEPMRSFATPMKLNDSRFGRVKRTYIECLQDNAIPIELQRLMQQVLPCDQVITLDTDHSPFFSAPEQLADALENIANTYGEVG